MSTLPPRVPLAGLIVRAVRRRCPACGGRPIFLTWFRLCPGCPVCGFQLERGERGYRLGAYFLNLVAIDVVFAVWFGGMLIATWPDPPWLLIHAVTVVLMVLTPAVFFPWSRTLFLALDIFVRPLEPGDFDGPVEPARIPRHREGA